MAEPADADNPEWTAADFRRARPATKIPVSIRLDAEIMRGLRERGPGWRTRVNEALAALIAEGRL